MITLSTSDESKLCDLPSVCMCKRTFIAILEDANLVGDRWGVSAHFKALRGQVPVGASPLAGQLHACALVLFYNLAQPKILHNAT